jgi:hypothetical protein
MSLAERFGICSAIPAMICSTLSAMPEYGLFLRFSFGICHLHARKPDKNCTQSVGIALSERKSL